jgi:hypothetical protein
MRGARRLLRRWRGALCVPPRPCSQGPAHGPPPGTARAGPDPARPLQPIPEMLLQTHMAPLEAGAPGGHCARAPQGCPGVGVAHAARGWPRGAGISGIAIVREGPGRRGARPLPRRAASRSQRSALCRPGRVPKATWGGARAGGRGRGGMVGLRLWLRGLASGGGWAWGRGLGKHGAGAGCAAGTGKGLLPARIDGGAKR